MRAIDLPPQARAEIDIALTSGAGQRDVFSKWGLAGREIGEYKRNFYARSIWPTAEEAALVLVTAAIACGENAYDLAEGKEGLRSRVYAFRALRHLFPATDPVGLARCVAAKQDRVYASNYDGAFRGRLKWWDEKVLCGIIVDCGVTACVVERARVAPVAATGRALVPSPSPAAKAIANFQRTRLNHTIARLPERRPALEVYRPEREPQRGDATLGAQLMGDPPFERSALFERLHRPMIAKGPEQEPLIVVPDAMLKSEE